MLFYNDVKKDNIGVRVHVTYYHAQILNLFCL